MTWIRIHIKIKWILSTGEMSINLKCLPRIFFPCLTPDQMKESQDVGRAVAVFSADYALFFPLPHPQYHHPTLYTLMYQQYNHPTLYRILNPQYLHPTFYRIISHNIIILHFTEQFKYLGNFLENAPPPPPRLSILYTHLIFNTWIKWVMLGGLT